MLGLGHGPPGSRLGLWYAILAAVFNGTFGVFSKLRSTRNEHPLIFNYWLAEGVALSGLLLLVVPPRVRKPLGKRLYSVAGHTGFIAIWIGI